MNYIDLFKASFILLFLGAYSALTAILLGRAMLNTAAALLECRRVAVLAHPAVRSSFPRPKTGALDFSPSVLREPAGSATAVAALVRPCLLRHLAGARIQVPFAELDPLKKEEILIGLHKKDDCQ